MQISLAAFLGEAGITYSLDRELSDHGVTDSEIKDLQKSIAIQVTQLLIKHGHEVVEDFEV